MDIFHVCRATPYHTSKVAGSEGTLKECEGPEHQHHHAKAEGYQTLKKLLLVLLSKLNQKLQE